MAIPSASDAAALLSDVEQSDGYPALSEHKLVRLEGGADSRVVPWYRDGELVAVLVAARHVHADGTSHWAVEAALSPRHRDPQSERELVASVGALVPGVAPHTVWAWRPAQVWALESLGYDPIRQIVRLERSLPLSQVADAEASVRIERFKQGRDEPFLIEVNNLAFAGHPEDGNLTSADLAGRMTRSWFDATGIFVARSGARVVGFCWTKLHPERLGEVYVIAVRPTVRDRGIGGVLLAAGLDDLHRRRGATRAMLWVERTNDSAQRLYARMGFRPVLVNTEFAMASSQPNR